MRGYPENQYGNCWSTPVGIYGGYDRLWINSVLYFCDSKNSSSKHWICICAYLCGLVCSHPKVQKQQLVRPNVYSFSLHTLGTQTC